MSVKGALDKLNITLEEMELLVPRVARQYSGGRIISGGRRRRTPGGAGPVSAGRPRKPVIARHFGFPNTGFYPPLTPAYAKRKAKLVGSKPMLVLFGAMKKSIVSRGTIRSIRPDTALILWKGVPDYTLYQKAFGRDPIKPNATDRRLIIARAKIEIKSVLRARLLLVRASTSLGIR